MIAYDGEDVLYISLHGMRKIIRAFISNDTVDGSFSISFHLTMLHMQYRFHDLMLYVTIEHGLAKVHIPSQSISLAMGSSIAGDAISHTNSTQFRFPQDIASLGSSRWIVNDIGNRR